MIAPTTRRDVFQAIADPNRRAIINLLARQRLTLNGIAAHFPISRPAISKHMRILVECGVVAIDQQGRERICALQMDKLNDVTNWMEPCRAAWNERLDALGAYLKDIQQPMKKTNTTRKESKHGRKNS